MRAGVTALLLAAAAVAGGWPVWAGAAAAQARRWRLSSHTCPPPVVAGVTDQSPRTCTFRNLYLLGGRAYYLAEGEPPALGRLGLDFELWRGKGSSRAPPDFVTAITPQRFSDLVAASGGARRGGAGSGGAGRSSALLDRFPLVYFWRAYAIRPDPLGGAPCDGQSRAPGITNYFHVLAEASPLLSATLCEQFGAFLTCLPLHARSWTGHCSPFRDCSILRVIDVRHGPTFPCHLHENYPPFYREALSCFTDKPLLHINGSTLRGRLALVETAWMGLGPRCRGSIGGCYSGGPRLPPTPGLMAAWRRTLGQCFGFPADAAAPLRPVRLLVVDRLYESGRPILNIRTILRELRSRFSPRQVQIRLEYMEGLTVRQQAQLFSQATVVVHVHGAVMANYAFLPQNAVTLHLAPVQHKWSPAFAMKLAKDLSGVTDIEVQRWANPDMSRVHIVQERADYQARRRPPVAQLLANTTFWRDFQLTHECPESLGEDQWETCHHYLMRALTASLPPEVVVNLTEAAIGLAFKKQQQRWEPMVLPTADGTAHEVDTEGGGAWAGWSDVSAPVVNALQRRGRSPGGVSFAAMAASAVCLVLWLRCTRPSPAGGGQQHLRQPP